MENQTIYVNAKNGQVFSVDGETLTEPAKIIQKKYMAQGYDGAILQNEFGDIDFRTMKFVLRIKPYAIVKYQKSRLQNYNPVVVEEFEIGEEQEAIEREEYYQDFDNAGEAYCLIERKATGPVFYHSGEEFDIK